jgi:hypothetical protein
VGASPCRFDSGSGYKPLKKLRGFTFFRPF